MFDLPKRFGREDTGETSIEYGLIAAGIAVGISMAALSLGAQSEIHTCQPTLSAEGTGTALGRPAVVKDGP